MSEKLMGRRGDLLRFGLASRNWIITQMSDDLDLMKWMPSGIEKSASQIVSHISWTVSATVMEIAAQLGIELNVEASQSADSQNKLESEIRAAYDLFKQLCTRMTEDMLDAQTTLPPPARIREGSVETILRIIVGYHTVHHAGQIAMLIASAKREEG
ncbi:MAG: hypothetical protein P1Q69_07730 [Candidatus Thorarchaeota archaeon]|nr:hypothetical protein [Candidatus Thorarchaeota archaeon]